MSQPAHLKRGLVEHQRARRREAVARVVAFERWLARGSKLRDIPPIPTDNEYAVAHAAGKTKRGGSR